LLIKAFNALDLKDLLYEFMLKIRNHNGHEMPCKRSIIIKTAIQSEEACSDSKKNKQM
jgi:hypothetical protein